MRVGYSVKHCYAIHLKFGDELLTSLTKLVFKSKAINCSMIKENLLLYCYKVSVFVAVVII